MTFEGITSYMAVLEYEIWFYLYCDKLSISVSEENFHQLLLYKKK